MAGNIPAHKQKALSEGSTREEYDSRPYRVLDNYGMCEYESQPRFKDGDVYCDRCGNKLTKMVTRATHDPKTGEKIAHYVLSCSKPVKKHVLFWTFDGDDGCGAY